VNRAAPQSTLDITGLDCIALNRALAARQHDSALDIVLAA
jgi:hypothetical protein